MFATSVMAKNAKHIIQRNSSPKVSHTNNLCRTFHTRVHRRNASTRDFGTYKLCLRSFATSNDNSVPKKITEYISGNNQPNVVRIRPYEYTHVTDTNTNVSRVEIGPTIFVRKDHDIVLFEPRPMVIIPPHHYCRINNPVMRGESGNILFDNNGQAKLRHGDQEIRFTCDPFPLYPGEELVGDVAKLLVVTKDSLLRLVARRDFVDTDSQGKSIQRKAGDEWQFIGPGTYIPRVEVDIISKENAIVIKSNTALQLVAKNNTKDNLGNERKAGEKWLVREVGPYLPGVDEVVGGIIKAIVLSPKVALHLRATDPYTDVFGKKRQAGEEWLITIKETDVHIPGVYEEIVGQVKITTLTEGQFCVIIDPYDPNTGKNLMGTKKLVKGEASFFLHPGESLQDGIQPVYVLGEHQALLIKAIEDGYVGESLSQEKKKSEDHFLTAGEYWMVHGPCKYIPPVNVEVLEDREAIPLDKNEGVYVRDRRSGVIRSVTGETYMLKAHEELWKKELPPLVEEIVMSQRDPMAYRTQQQHLQKPIIKERVKHRVVTYEVPHNSAVQIYDFEQKKARVVVGPDLAMLGPHEQFTLMSLSGGRPKRGSMKKVIALLLGPDFMTDLIEVETSDHARLRMQIAYNWHFAVDRNSETSVFKAFQVPDFVGDACKALASKIRAAVASVSFDTFHRDSVGIIHRAIFGDKIPELIFPANELVITSVDMQMVEPIDSKTQESLQKSVQLAIEITTNSQEAAARHEAERIEQMARGKLERQTLLDQVEAEKSRKAYLEFSNENERIQVTGSALAKVIAQVESKRVLEDHMVKTAQLKAEAAKIEFESELENKRKLAQFEFDHKKQMLNLDLEKQQKLAEIEIERTKALVKELGPQTIEAIARAGPEMQAKLLSGLGLKGYLISDGKTPLNLFGTAMNFLGQSQVSNESPKGTQQAQKFDE